MMVRLSMVVVMTGRTSIMLASLPSFQCLWHHTRTHHLVQGAVPYEADFWPLARGGGGHGAGEVVREGGGAVVLDGAADGGGRKGRGGRRNGLDAAAAGAAGAVVVDGTGGGGLGLLVLNGGDSFQHGGKVEARGAGGFEDGGWER